MTTLDTSKINEEEIKLWSDKELLVINKKISQALLDTLIKEGVVTKDLKSIKKLELNDKLKNRLKVTNQTEILWPIWLPKRLLLKRKFEKIKSLSEAKTDDEKDLAMRQVYYQWSWWLRKVFWRMWLKKMDAKKIEAKTQNYIKKMEEKANNSSSEKAKLIRQDMQSYSKVIYNNYINTIKPKAMDVDEDDLALAA